jgi:hypothetical protein
MSINDPSQIHYIANVRVPGGGNNISLEDRISSGIAPIPTALPPSSSVCRRSNISSGSSSTVRRFARIARKQAIFVEMRQAEYNSQHLLGKGHTENSNAPRIGIRPEAARVF